MIATAPTFTIHYSREREHAAETRQLKARIAELEAQLAQYTQPEPEPPRLTPAQARILELIACCLTREQIAERLCVSDGTVRRHASDLYRKLGVSNRVQAARWAWRHGYVDMDAAWRAVTAQQWGIEP